MAVKPAIGDKVVLLKKQKRTINNQEYFAGAITVIKGLGHALQYAAPDEV